MTIQIGSQQKFVKAETNFTGGAVPTFIGQGAPSKRNVGGLPADKFSLSRENEALVDLTNQSFRTIDGSKKSTGVWNGGAFAAIRVKPDALKEVFSHGLESAQVKKFLVGVGENATGPIQPTALHGQVQVRPEDTQVESLGNATPQAVFGKIKGWMEKNGVESKFIDKWKPDIQALASSLATGGGQKPDSPSDLKLYWSHTKPKGGEALSSLTVVNEKTGEVRTCSGVTNRYSKGSLKQEPLKSSYDNKIVMQGGKLVSPSIGTLQGIWANEQNENRKAGIPTTVTNELEKTPPGKVMSSMHEAQRVIQEIRAAHPELREAEQWGINGCMNRASLICNELEKRGYSTFKIFSSGNGVTASDKQFKNIGWKWHVVPGAIVKDGDKYNVVYFETALKPKNPVMTENQWQKLINPSKQSVQVQYTDKAQYQPIAKGQSPTPANQWGSTLDTSLRDLNRKVWAEKKLTDAVQ